MCGIRVLEDLLGKPMLPLRRTNLKITLVNLTCKENILSTRVGSLSNEMETHKTFAAFYSLNSMHPQLIRNDRSTNGSIWGYTHSKNQYILII